jgi:hypothetical protein
VFAGAAREAVFSNPDVIRRVNADFVPVALKAGLVNNPPDNDEGRLYREIVRSKLAPQGICVVNSAGKVLDWVLMFDDDKSVLAFLDHAARRFAKYPDAKKRVPAERYMKYPSQKHEDMADSGEVLSIPECHAAGTHCPATPPLRKGTVVARVFGRALDKDGRPMADTVPQEHYVEDRFHVPVVMQETLTKSLADAGTEPFRLADDLARLLVSRAYLGQLDVDPFGSVPGSKGNLKYCQLWAKAELGGNGPVRLHIDGKSEAAGGPSDGQDGGDARLWQHEVKLTWEGIIEMKKDRMIRLLLVARGSEKLKWGNKLQQLKGQADVTILPAGHAVDLNCGVRYGIIGAPVAGEQAGADEAGAEDSDPEDQASRQLTEALGTMFLVFRDKIQKDLKVSDEQKQKLAKRLQHTLQDAMPFFEKLGGKKAEEREKALQPYRQQVTERLASFLEGLLKDEQLKRLRQLELQQEGPFALLFRPDLGNELKITDEQRQQFVAVVQELQKKIAPLIKEAESGGNPIEIRPKIMKIKNEHGDRIEAILSEAQKKQWQEMLGKPLEEKPATPEALKAEKETRYLAFQIFTYGPDPRGARMGEGSKRNYPHGSRRPATRRPLRSCKNWKDI